MAAPIISITINGDCFDSTAVEETMKMFQHCFTAGKNAGLGQRDELNEKLDSILKVLQTMKPELFPGRKKFHNYWNPWGRGAKYRGTDDAHDSVDDMSDEDKIKKLRLADIDRNTKWCREGPKGKMRRPVSNLHHVNQSDVTLAGKVSPVHLSKKGKRYSSSTPRADSEARTQGIKVSASTSTSTPAPDAVKVISRALGPTPKAAEVVREDLERTPKSVQPVHEEAQPQPSDSTTLSRPPPAQAPAGPTAQSTKEEAGPASATVKSAEDLIRKASLSVAKPIETAVGPAHAPETPNMESAVANSPFQSAGHSTPSEPTPSQSGNSDVHMSEDDEHHTLKSSHLSDSVATNSSLTTQGSGSTNPTEFDPDTMDYETDPQKLQDVMECENYSHEPRDTMEYEHDPQNPEAPRVEKPSKDEDEEMAETEIHNDDSGEMDLDPEVNNTVVTQAVPVINEMTENPQDQEKHVEIHNGDSSKMELDPEPNNAVVAQPVPVIDAPMPDAATELNSVPKVQNYSAVESSNEHDVSPVFQEQHPKKTTFETLMTEAATVAIPPTVTPSRAPNQTEPLADVISSGPAIPPTRAPTRNSSSTLGPSHSRVLIPAPLPAALPAPMPTRLPDPALPPIRVELNRLINNNNSQYVATRETGLEIPDTEFHYGIARETLQHHFQGNPDAARTWLTNCLSHPDDKSLREQWKAFAYDVLVKAILASIKPDFSISTKLSGLERMAFVKDVFLAFAHSNRQARLLKPHEIREIVLEKEVRAVDAGPKLGHVDDALGHYKEVKRKALLLAQKPVKVFEQRYMAKEREAAPVTARKRDAESVDAGNTKKRRPE